MNHLCENYETKEDFKDDDDDDDNTSNYSCIYTPYNIDTLFTLDEKKKYEYYNYPVWIAINTIIKTIMVIENDFQSDIIDTGDLVEIMRKILMNIDGIYIIRYDTYEHGIIHIAEKAKVEGVKQLLHKYYEMYSVIIIRVNNKEIIDLDKFTYGIFQFKKVGNYLYIFV